jgi:hypothetical protein
MQMNVHACVCLCFYSMSFILTSNSESAHNAFICMKQLQRNNVCMYVHMFVHTNNNHKNQMKTRLTLGSAFFMENVDGI